MEATIGVTFEYNPVSQFDQGGLLIYLDSDHWMKCGLEFCDGKILLSVVICNHGYSDWSTQNWGDVPSCKLRVHKVPYHDSVVVEAASTTGVEKDVFRFVRIAHLSTDSARAKGLSWQVGPFAACPTAQKECHTNFTEFFVGPKLETEHKAVLL